jgi:hypothetical protein
MRQNDNGRTSIQDKFLDSGDLFALRFSDGLVFLEVTGWEQNKVAPFTQFDEVPGKGQTGYQRLEVDDDDILYMDKGVKKVKHASIGHTPPSLRRYTNYPESQNRLRQLENVGAPSVGDDFGYVDGQDSPYQQPTDVEELFIPPGTHLDFNFYNGDDEAHTPVLNVVLREYNVNIVDTSGTEGKKVVKRVMSPGSPIPIAPVGSKDRQVEFNLGDNWGVEPMSPERARRLG